MNKRRKHCVAAESKKAKHLRTGFVTSRLKATATVKNRYRTKLAERGSVTTLCFLQSCSLCEMLLDPGEVGKEVGSNMDTLLSRNEIPIVDLGHMGKYLL